MKFGVLKSVGHNIADSLAGGCGFLVGLCPTDIFGEAAASPEGEITVDFLAGASSGAVCSPDLARAIGYYSEALRNLCEAHGFEVSEIATLAARYSIDDTREGLAAFTVAVTVADRRGRSSMDQYFGLPLKRVPRMSRPS